MNCGKQKIGVRALEAIILDEESNPEITKELTKTLREEMGKGVKELFLEEHIMNFGDCAFLKTLVLLKCSCYPVSADHITSIVWAVRHRRV